MRRVVERAADAQLGARPRGRRLAVNQLSASSSPSVAEVKIQALRRALRAARSACSRMSSGDSTSRACCGVDVDPAHVAAAASAGESAAAARASCGARSCELGEVGRDVAAPSPAPRPRRRRPAASAVQRGGESRRAGALFPAQLSRRARRAARRRRPGADRAPHARTRAASSAHGCRPRACCRPAASRSRAKSITWPLPQLRAEELHAGLDQLVRLVEHRRIDGRQQLGDAAVAQRHVGEEQVVVDDHQVGRHRVAPRLHHVAVAVSRAIGAEAVVARRRDQRDHRRAVVEAVDLGQVAGAWWPAAQCSMRASARTAKRSGNAASARACCEPVQAQVAGAAFQQRQPRPAACSASRSRGRSRRNSWSCRLLVAVLTSARAPDSSSGTR